MKKRQRTGPHTDNEKETDKQNRDTVGMRMGPHTNNKKGMDTQNTDAVGTRVKHKRFKNK